MHRDSTGHLESHGNLFMGMEGVGGVFIGDDFGGGELRGWDFEIVWSG